jgi:hypothetical protein
MDEGSAYFVADRPPGNFQSLLVAMAVSWSVV